MELLERETNAAIAQAFPLLPRELTQAEAAEMPELVRTVNAMPPQSAKCGLSRLSAWIVSSAAGRTWRTSAKSASLKLPEHAARGKQNKRIEIVLE